MAMIENAWKIEREFKDHAYGPHVGETIFLLKLEEFRKLPGNTVLVNIFGFEVLKKHADDETRAGYVAYGTVER